MASCANERVTGLPPFAQAAASATERMPAALITVPPLDSTTRIDGTRKEFRVGVTGRSLTQRLDVVRSLPCDRNGEMTAPDENRDFEPKFSLEVSRGERVSKIRVLRKTGSQSYDDFRPQGMSRIRSAFRRKMGKLFDPFIGSRRYSGMECALTQARSAPD